MFQFNLIKEKRKIVNVKYGLLKVIFAFYLFQTFAFTQTSDFKYNDLGVAFDYARFAADGGVVLEVYLTLPRQNLNFVKNEKGFDADVIYQVALIQDGFVKYGPERWSRNFKARSLADSRQKANVPELASFAALPGDYILRIDVFDMNGQVRQQINEPVSLTQFPNNKLVLSDIQIASNIITTMKENEFSKYGKDIVPNAKLMFNSTMPNVYYYVEIYNVNKDEEYQFEVVLKNRDQRIVDIISSTTKRMVGTDFVEMGRGNIANLKSGKYSIGIKVSSEKNNQNAEQFKEFYIYNPVKNKQNTFIMDVDPVALAIDNSELIEMLSVFLNPQKYKAILSADDDVQQDLLNDVWRNLEILYPQKSGSFKREFFKRIEAAEQYGGFKKEGWKTDRGRVLRQYGFPDEVETHDMGLAEKPWEVWRYHDLQGGVEFIFLSRSGYGTMELVHSTAQNEIYYTEWTKWIN